MMDRQESFISLKNSVPHVGSDDEEDSFVVLGTSSSFNDIEPYSLKEEVLPPLRTNKVHEMQSLIKMKISQINSEPLPDLPAAVDALDADCLNVAKITISPDSSYEEIQKQVEELIKENETLKNIIAQNNMSMKTQYERFIGYRDEVTKVMKSYREKFNEAKVCIDKLKEENAKLISDVEVYINIKKLHEEEIINLKDKVREHELTSCIDLKLSDSELNTKLKDLQTALAEAELKNKELVDENQNCKSAMCKLEEEVKKLTVTLVSSAKLEEDLLSKQQELEILKTDKNALETRVKNIIEKHNQREEELLRQMKEWKEKTNDLQEKLHNTCKESEKLVQSANVLTNYQQQLKTKDAEIVNLRQSLETTTFSESALQDQIKNLKSKLAELQNQYDPRLEEDYSQTRRQLSFAQATITTLELERENNIKTIEELRKLLQESNAKSDEMFALKEQVELYKNDFEAERESKTSLKREKDQLAEDLQNVQKRNKQLQNEIGTLRAREHPRAEGYTCPKCNFGFSTYQSLENHVHRCLDLDGFP